ncbi:hypothetical protein Sste5346_010299 [Sporothrix stenoceras]|uniref:Cupin 2 conserved barrel domain-containing protein n=1 Tax=Sporothrix stenoceras TaxID=5173 RepID=A0ABR3YHK0_9PEZI
MALPSNGQPSSASLSQQQIFITSHNSDAKAIVHSENKFKWLPFDNDQMAFSLLYSTSQFPPNLNGDADIKSHDALLKAPLSLVNPAGTILRCVDFCPSYKCAMHRTQSLDYGIVLAGTIDMVLDSGDVRHLKAGDVVVQRATNHQWINTSETEWARMMFVLQATAPVTVGDTTLGEDLGEGADLLPEKPQ